MNLFDKLSLEQLRTRSSEKWTNYAPDVLPLWVAEMDTIPPKEMVSAVNQTFSNGDVGYLSTKGFNAYVDAFCKWSKRHFNVEINPDVVADTTDVVSGCKQVINAYLEHNSNNTVIISTPVYPPFINGYTNGYKYVDVPLQSGNDYALDFVGLDSAFSKAVSGGKKAVYALCNPQNPTGKVLSQGDLQRLVDLSSKYGVLIVSDEIHGALAFQHNFIPIMSLPDADFVITVTSASKAFSIPGIKSALIIPSNHPSNKAVDFMWQSGHFRRGSAGMIGSLAQTICMNECDYWLADLQDSIAENIVFSSGLIDNLLPYVAYSEPDSTYFMWLDFEKYFIGEKSEVSPSKFFLDNARVALNPGQSFAKPQNTDLITVENHTIVNKYNTFVRVNLATNQEIIRECFKKIAKSL